MPRTLLAALAVGLLTPPAALAAAIVSWVSPRSDSVVQIGRLWARCLMAAMGVTLVVRGLDRGWPKPPFVLIANHQSLVDILAILPAMPPAARFVAKKELFRIPIFGWALRASGCVPIDRGHRARAIRSLGAAGEAIRAGRPFVLFAEGTRSRDGKMGPFKRGAFHVAVQTRATVVPVAISGGWRILRPKSLRVRPGRVRVTLGEPIDIDPFLPGDIDGLSSAVRTVLTAGLEADELHRDDRTAVGHDDGATAR